MRPLSSALVTLLLWPALAFAAPPETRLTEGLRDRTPEVYALVGAKVIAAPGRVFERATIVVRDGRIEAVGPEIPIPPDARVVPLAGKTVYPGFIDAYGTGPVLHERGEGDPSTGAEQGVPYGNALITPELSAARIYRVDPSLHADLRSQGFVARLVPPAAGVVRGTSVLTATDDGPLAAGLLQRRAALHVHLYVSRSPRRLTYPNSPMGAVALARQAFLDAAWYRHQGPRPPEPNDALDALQAYLPPLAGAPPDRSPPLVVFDADTEQYLLRAEDFAREFGLRAVYRGGGREYRRLKEIAAAGRTIIAPVAFPAPPNVATRSAELNAELDDLLHWHFAPENPARLEQAGVKLALTTHGLDSPTKFLAGLRKAVARGWPADAALRALTTTPAELYGVRDRLGAVEPGLLASFVIADGDLFSIDGKVVETWVAGRPYAVVERSTFDVRGDWRLTWRRPDPLGAVLRIDGPLDEPSARLHDVAGHDGPLPLTHFELREERLDGTFEAKPLSRPGAARLSMTFLELDGRLAATGRIVWPDGRTDDVTAVHETAVKTPPSNPAAAPVPNPAPAPSAPGPVELSYPLGAFGRPAPGPPPGPSTVLFRQGRIWTCGPAGVLADADLLISDGRIVAVGRSLEAPPGAAIVELGGRHVSPGLIDSHSHIATDGGVNETGRAIVCQVRVGDFIDANDVNLYRQLAGGVTTALILHGSANPIGGQGEVIKFRWGLNPRELKFAGAPPTVKFALGENVTKGPDILAWRYPYSRMGVEQLHRDALRAARDYQARHDAWRERPVGPPPRRDLELECLAEVLAGKRWIHCHAYRQDEILTFLQVLEDFQVRVGCLHHASEGYKVADAMLRHGAMSATFSDWWAFKVETLDAIAYNGAFLHRAGVVTSFHSDDRELGRHLNHEAAKAMRYGDLTPVEALQFVTIAPAKQLRIDTMVGSLEPGKHADLVVWSRSPLEPHARCEQTWIDGRKYFDRDDDLRRRAATDRLRSTLVQTILASGEPMLEVGADYSTDKESWDREDKYCRRREGRDRSR